MTDCIHPGYCGPRFMRLIWALMLLCCFSANAAVDTSTNLVSMTELHKKWDPVPLSEVQKAAKDGDVHAMHYLGHCYADGSRVTRDATQALAWYKRGMQAGYLMSANNLGVLYYKGALGSNGMSQALYYYNYAAERGLAMAQANLGVLYRDGNGVPQDTAQAMHWFQLAAAQGSPLGMVQMGRLYRFGRGVETNLNEAIRWFEKAVDGTGDALAKLNLGLAYEDQGQFQKAVALYQQAADQDSTDAMVELYLSYWSGRGVTNDHAKAIEWLTKAGNEGDPYAQCLLGDYYETREFVGDGPNHRLTAPNWSQAFHWSSLAAQQNWAGGQYHLGMLYIRGEGVERDEARGLELVRAAADQGLEAALHDLAELYAQGIGAPRGEADRPINLLRRSKSWEELMRRYELGFGTERDIFSAAECYCEITRLDVPYYWRCTLSDKIEYHPGKRQNGYRSSRADDDHVSIALPLPWEEGSDDLRHALSLYLKSARGDGQAAFMIGNRYLNGQDAPQSATRAWIWFSLAAQNGSVEAPAKVKELESKFTPGKLKIAREQYASLIQNLRRFRQ